MSNLDYIKSSLAVSNSRAGRSQIPQSNRNGNQTSNRLWWFMVALILVVIFLANL